MKNKNFVTSLLFFGCFFLFSAVHAQDGGGKREVGLQFSSLDFTGSSFGAFFKKEKKENVYRRIRFAAGAIDFGLLEETTDFNFAAALAIGREKRKALDAKLIFYHGPEFAARVQAVTLWEDDIAMTIQPSFGWVIGLQHSFNDRWAINIETIPTFYVAANINTIDEGLLFGVGGSNFVSLGVVRKF